jgi:hypothetical protein
MIRTLVEHDVRFVVIGGVAGTIRGSSLVTYDIDICYARDVENLEHLAAALKAMEATLRGASDDVPFILDAKTLKAGDCFTFSTRFGPLDVLGTPAGTRGYDDLESGASSVEVFGLRIRVAAIDDLIRMKRAAGRPKDRAAVEILGRLRDEIDERERQGQRVDPE